MEYLENLIRAPIQCVRMLRRRGNAKSHVRALHSTNSMWVVCGTRLQLRSIRESGASCQNFFSGHDFDFVGTSTWRSPLAQGKYVLF